MKRFLLFALCLAVAGSVLAGGRPDNFQVVLFQDATGTQHAYWLDKPVAFSDSLGVSSAIRGLAIKEQLKGSDSFLRAISEGAPYTDSGSLCYVTARSGGRVYFCGNCGGAGCAQIKVIQ